jgi:hypothetical protein
MKKFIIYLFLINAVSFASGIQDSNLTGGIQNIPVISNEEKTAEAEEINKPSAAITENNTTEKNAETVDVKNTAAPVSTKKLPVSKPVKTAAVPADSIDLSALVQSQVEAAQAGEIKSGINYQVPEKVKPEPVKPKVKVKKQEAGMFENIVITLNNFNRQYLNVTIFIAGSVLILGFFLGRRLLKTIFGQSKRKLKKSINLIRNEKPVYVQNKKLYELRSKLAESNNIYDMSEESIPGKARNMNVGKGEIMLAAKIKAFQLSKISK